MYSEFSNEEVVTELYEKLNIRRPNILGIAEAAVFTSRPKSDPGRAIADIERLSTRYRKLKEAIEFDRYEDELEVEACHAQLLRAFGATRDARAMSVAPLRGGKSGASVYAVQYWDAHGNVVLDAVAKCDLWERVSDEESKFQRFVLGRLANGTYAPLLNATPIMCGRYAAMFYERLDKSVGDLSSAWSSGETTAVSIVNDLSAIEARWTAATATREMTVGSLRRLMVSDDSVDDHAGLLSAPWRSVEAVVVSERLCLQHGDLHAGNVLLSETGKPYLLDFANIAELPAGFDAITLELAYIFNNPNRARSAWPRVDDVHRWMSAKDYFASSPAGPLLSAARTWTLSCFRGLPQKSLYASAYAYCMRQVQYPDTDKELLDSLLTVVCAGLLR
jgi:hypothetical protein